mmetsp:Transcript_12226/g.33390  ORF Transcript_12226/g.33390 Transcript_12226/m.33390 type:complete len:247 (-) Transcript_12226:377-1117(-)
MAVALPLVVVVAVACCHCCWMVVRVKAIPLAQVGPHISCIWRNRAGAACLCTSAGGTPHLKLLQDCAAYRSWRFASCKTARGRWDHLQILRNGALPKKASSFSASGLSILTATSVVWAKWRCAAGMAPKVTVNAGGRCQCDDHRCEPIASPSHSSVGLQCGCQYACAVSQWPEHPGSAIAWPPALRKPDGATAGAYYHPSPPPLPTAHRGALSGGQLLLHGVKVAAQAGQAAAKVNEQQRVKETLT